MIIDDRTGQVPEAWTGFQVAWTMARGYAGAFGRKVNALWRVAPAVPPVPRPVRRPASGRSGCCTSTCSCCSAFSVSLAFFNHANIGISVPLAYPLLAYLLVRMLWSRSAASPAPPPSRCACSCPRTVARGGDRVPGRLPRRPERHQLQRDRRRLRGRDRRRPPDRRQRALRRTSPPTTSTATPTGPVNYYAYVPFEQVWPWSGTLGRPARRRTPRPWRSTCSRCCGCGCWDGVSAGPRLGSRSPTPGRPSRSRCSRLNSNSNDALVAMLVVLALLVARRPPARGAAGGARRA